MPGLLFCPAVDPPARSPRSVPTTPAALATLRRGGYSAREPIAPPLTAGSAAVPDAPPKPAPKPASKSDNEKPIYLVSYPKIVLLYPTFLGAIAAGLIELFLAKDSLVAQSLGWGFLWLFALNIVVLSFDFPRTTSLTLFFLVMAAGLGVVLAATNYPELMPNVYAFFKEIKPSANSTFYFLFAAILGLLYLFVLVLIRFDYWEVRPNELLHHHGFLSSLERFSAPSLRITKEIDDVFEYLLMGSGRLVLHPSNEPRAFVLDNVPFIAAKEARITKMLGALQVQLREDNLPPRSDGSMG
jgi:hypothetical protein